MTETLSREIAGLRDEMRAIRAIAEEQRPQDDMRADIARLAESLQQLETARMPGTDGLKQDFNALRSLMDGLPARKRAAHGTALERRRGAPR